MSNKISSRKENRKYFIGSLYVDYNIFLIYYNIFLKTKKKPYGNKVTEFYNKEIPKVNSNHTYLAVISLDSALKKDENYHPQVLLKERKYIEKEKMLLGKLLMTYRTLLTKNRSR